MNSYALVAMLLCCSMLSQSTAVRTPYVAATCTVKAGIYPTKWDNSRAQHATTHDAGTCNYRNVLAQDTGGEESHFLNASLLLYAVLS